MNPAKAFLRNSTGLACRAGAWRDMYIHINILRYIYRYVNCLHPQGINIIGRSNASILPIYRYIYSPCGEESWHYLTLIAQISKALSPQQKSRSALKLLIETPLIA